MREVLKASDGMIYTNGEIYGVQLHLSEEMKKEEFFEIPIEEYKKTLEDAEIIMEDHI